jgi:acyl-coenzyme A thioesterase PaaI-like protein
MADQDRYAPNSICFGCGPANPDGLHIKSHWQGEGDDRVFVMTFEPVAAHQAFPGVINGGILGALLDCHSNWCAATSIMHAKNWAAPDCTVTADFHVKLRRPTPFPGTLTVTAKPVMLEDRTCKVEAAVTAMIDGVKKVTATCTGTFVAVKEGHPAYHRWA